MIETELIANGITSLEDIRTFTDFILHSYGQVKNWLNTYADVNIKQMAGL